MPIYVQPTQRAVHIPQLGQGIGKSGIGGLAPRRAVSASPSSFTYYATAFAGGANDYLTRGAAITGATDSKLGLLSFWIKMGATTDNNDYNIMSSGPDIGGHISFGISRSGGLGNAIRILGRNTIGDIRVDLRSLSGTVAEASGWVHVLCSWDTSNSANKYLYINNTASLSVGDFITDAIVDFSEPSQWYFPAGNGGGGPLKGSICEFYFTTPASFFDISNSANRAKFISGGKPVNLGADGSTPTGTQPLIYFHNDYTSFGTQQGSGGNFSLHAGGTLSNDPSIP